MSYFSMLSISIRCVLLLLLLRHGCVAAPDLPEPKCQVPIAVEPDTHIPSEGGSTEIWNPNSDLFQCAGVQVVRYNVQPNALFLPSYTNANKLAYILQGKGVLGLINPGCFKDYESVKMECRKIRNVQSGDVVAFRAGEGVWMYNSGNETLTVIAIHRIIDIEGLRKFSLAGSQKIWKGFSSEFLNEAFNIDDELATELRSKDLRGSISNMNDGGSLSSDSPCPRPDQRYDVDEFFCNVNTRLVNISDPSNADIFIPELGQLTTIDAVRLPVLESIQLSVSYQVQLKDVMILPNWENSYSIIYIVKGEGHIQVVDESGKSVFDNIVNEGQIIVIPQYLVLAKKAKSEIFEYVTFKTTAKPITSYLSGKNSVLYDLPLEVIKNSFKITEYEAMRLKFGRQETVLAKIMSRNI